MIKTELFAIIQRLRGMSSAQMHFECLNFDISDIAKGQCPGGFLFKNNKSQIMPIIIISPHRRKPDFWKKIKVDPSGSQWP